MKCPARSKGGDPPAALLAFATSALGHLPGDASRIALAPAPSDEAKGDGKQGQKDAGGLAVLLSDTSGSLPPGLEEVPEKQGTAANDFLHI